MHLGFNNIRNEYAMGNIMLEKTIDEKDLGVVFNSGLKVSQQCSIASNKLGNKVLGIIKRTIVSRYKKITLPLYKSLMRPHLDHCKQIWNPFLKEDIDILEKVQKKATKMIKSCEGLDYKSRLKQTNLTSLEIWAVRADLLEVFKFFYWIRES